MTNLPEWRLVRAVASGAEAAAVREAFPACRPERLLWLGHRHRLLAPLAAALRRASLPLPRNLEASALASARLGLHLAGETQRLVAALEGEGLRAIPIGGPVIAATAYERPSLREVTHLDLLTTPGELGAVARSIEQASYVRSSRPDPREPLSLRHAGSGTIASLHVDLGEPWRGARCFDELWARRQTVTIARRPVRVLGAADLLVTTCLARRATGWRDLRSVSDVAAILARRPLTWTALERSARTLGGLHALRLGLALAERLLGTAVPRAARVGRDRSRRLGEEIVRAEHGLVHGARDDGPRDPGAGDARDIPFEPTPEAVVSAMLDLARAGATDVLLDLGCGDGRIVIEAARRGARGIGIDSDSARIESARAAARAAGVESSVRFETKDLEHAPLREATIVATFLYPDVNARIIERARREMSPGARFVSHRYDAGAIAPDSTELVVHGMQVSIVHAWRESLQRTVP